jgi:hypothetical protein
VILDDVKYFVQFCNLTTFAERAENDDDFKRASLSDKYFQKVTNAGCHCDLLKTVELFFCNHSHNADANAKDIFLSVHSKETGFPMKLWCSLTQV